MIEPPRIAGFRKSLIKEIPRFPNNKETLAILEAKPLGEILIDYMNWRIRYIAPRPRQLVVENAASSDPRWESSRADIEKLSRAIEAGHDLTPYLSLKPHTRGFTPSASATGPRTDRWSDKDMLLNIMGYHHLHLDAAPTKGMRSDDMLFVQVTRETCTVAGIFDHSVFEHTAPGAKMTPERERLWSVFDEHVMRGVPPGAVVAMPPIATSGHPVQLVMMAMRYAKMVHATDARLDDRAYVEDLYDQARFPKPAKPELRWRMHFLDLCLVDKSGTHAFVFHKGMN